MRKARFVSLTVRPQQPSSELKTCTCTQTHACIIRQEVTKREKQSGGNSELKIDYRWTDYHNKGWGKVVK